MSEKLRFILSHAKARANAVEAVRNAPEGYYVEVKPPTRSLEQNARLWAFLTDVSEQVDWYGQKLSPEDWKTMFTASLRKANVVPGIDQGSFVVTGLHTSKMTKAELSDLLELISAFGTERGVVFHDQIAEASETR